MFLYRSVNNISSWTNLVKSINVLTGMETKRGTPNRGRPREFDADMALERAMDVFWRKGYEGASLPELTRAMGINRPSMYAAFGNKEQLFSKVLERYASGAATFIDCAVQKPTAKEMIERVLRGAADFLSASGHPRGCMLVQAPPPCGDESDSVRREVIERRSEGETMIRQRLKRADDEGELARGADPADIARFIAAVVHGMAVQAAGGAKRPQLQAIAEMAIAACATSLRQPPSARSR
jgi:AcrR family transcriptional regulator